MQALSPRKHMFCSAVSVSTVQLVIIPSRQSNYSTVDALSQ